MRGRFQYVTPILIIKHASVMFQPDKRLALQPHTSSLAVSLEEAKLRLEEAKLHVDRVVLMLHILQPVSRQERTPDWVCEVCTRGGSRDGVSVKKVFCAQRLGSSEHSTPPWPHLQGTPLPPSH